MREPHAIFDEWITGLSRYDKKMLSIMLAQVWKLIHTSPALEAVHVLGVNEKTVRKYGDENKGKFEEEKGKSTKGRCLIILA
jgi:hypothetical protein